jgi:C-terminal processing protease CtpA/Prc
MTAATDGAIGVPVFRRSKLILDYAHSRAIIEPLAGFAEPDAVDASGLTVVRDAGDDSSLRVSYVIKGSVGDVAGIQAGDVVESIDGLASTQSKTQAARESLRAAGKTSHLVLRRGNQTIETDLHLRMII